MSDKKSEDPISHRKVGVTVSTPCFGGMINEAYFHSVLKHLLYLQQISGSFILIQWEMRV